MRLSLKLAAFGIILLLPKTQAYLSNAYLSEVQTAPERAMSAPVAHWNVNSISYPTLSAEGKQAESSMCAAKPGHEAGDAAVIHAMDESPKGS